MKTIKERLVVVWDDDGNFKGASLDERTVLDDGRTLNSQRPLTEADADALVGAVDVQTVAQLAAMTTERDELLAEVASLQAQLPQPLGDREITPREFLQRISAEDRLAIMASADPRCLMAMMELFTTLTVNLDSPELAGLIDALVDAGINIDADDRAAIFA